MGQKFKMLKQLQQMQAKMAKIQEELGEKTVTGTAGGGVVEVVANGHQKVLSVTLKPEVVDPADVEMLQDLVLAAVNDAMDRARELASKEMGAVTAGIGLPPGLMGEDVADVPAALTRVMEELGRLPGIGPKTAQRLSFYILRTPRESVDRLAAALVEVKARIRFCDECFFIAEGARCAICTSARRDRGVLCVVEEPLDVLAIERTGEYHGLYPVLQRAVLAIGGG